MKVQKNILLEKIKKSWLWLLILIILLTLQILSCHIKSAPFDFESDFLPLIGYKQNFNQLSLLTIFQIVFIIYFTIIFYTYEVEYSFENVFLRMSSKKWLIFKLLFIFLFIIIFRLTYFMIIYIGFAHLVVSFKLSFILYSFLYYFFISIVTITMKNIGKKHEIFMFVSSLLIGVLSCVYLSWQILLVIAICLIIINIYVFHFYRISE